MTLNLGLLLLKDEVWGCNSRFIAEQPRLADDSSSLLKNEEESVTSVKAKPSGHFNTDNHNLHLT